MIELQFGQALERILSLAGIKNYVIAQELGYDVSYISKWVRGNNIPSRKNIYEICNKIAAFLVSECKNKNFNDVVSFLELQGLEQSKTEEAKEAIMNALLCSYEIAENKISGRANIFSAASDLSLNSSLEVGSKLRRKQALADLARFIKKDNAKKNIEMIICSDFWDTEQSLSYIGFLSEMSNILRGKIINVSYFGNAANIAGQDNGNILPILCAMTSFPNINFKMYDYSIHTDTKLLIVKDCLAYITTWLNNGGQIFSNIIQERSVIEELFANYAEFGHKGVCINSEIDAKSLLTDSDYNHLLMCGKQRWVLGHFNELLMPHELYIECAAKVFRGDSVAIAAARKTDVILKNISLRSPLQIIIYRSVLSDYINNGNLRFFNTPVRMNYERRIKHLEYIVKLLEENRSINLIVKDDDPFERFSVPVAPCILSDESGLISTVLWDVSKPNYVKLKTAGLTEGFDIMFDNLSSYTEEERNAAREHSIGIIKNSLNVAIAINTCMNTQDETI